METASLDRVAKTMRILRHRIFTQRTKMSLKPSHSAVFFAIVAIQFVPTLKNFHVESALFISAIFFFWGLFRGLSSVKHATEMWILVGVGLMLFDFSRGCLSEQGLFLWLIHPMSSFLFGSSLYALSDAIFPQRRVFLSLILGLSVSLMEVVVPLLTLPHVYLFGHSFGFWPGPVYDRAVLVDALHIVARLSTLSLSLFLFLWARALLFRKRFPLGAFIISILCFLISIETGVYRTHDSLKKELGSSVASNDIILIYDASVFSSRQSDSLLTTAQTYVDEISEKMNIGFPENTSVEIYVYNHAWQKKELTGAKYTSYVPVWQNRHRIHITKQALASTLKHEMVHVVAKEFGNWFGASYNAALIEGLAVALAQDSTSEYSNTDLVRAWDLHHKINMQKMLSLAGFYSGRGSQSYSAAGAFVEFVLGEKGAEFVKEWYKKGHINNEKEQLPELIDRWKVYVDSLPVDSSLIQTSQKVYSRKSPIELDCPHVFTQLETDADRAFFAVAEGDTTTAKEVIKKYATDSTLYSRLNEALFNR